MKGQRKALKKSLAINTQLTPTVANQ